MQEEDPNREEKLRAIKKALEDMYKEDYEFFNKLSMEQAKEIAEKYPMRIPLEFAMLIQSAEDYQPDLEQFKKIKFETIKHYILNRQHRANAGISQNHMFLANIKAMGFEMPKPPISEFQEEVIEPGREDIEYSYKLEKKVEYDKFYNWFQTLDNKEAEEISNKYPLRIPLETVMNLSERNLSWEKILYLMKMVPRLGKYHDKNLAEKIFLANIKILGLELPKSELQKPQS